MWMNLLLHTYNTGIIAEIDASSIILKSEQDAIHLLEALFESGAAKIILHRENIAPEFFDLSTRLAGAVLQKFVNYHIQVAIVGDFSSLTSDSLKAFIYESNRGKHVFFLESVEKAVQKMIGVDTVDRTAWMVGHYGVMSHWLFPGVMPEQGELAKSLDQAVDDFNLDRLLEDFEASGAEWYLFTLGQNTGKYASPNPVIEALAGPGHCSQRDLALEIARGVHALGKRFIAYLPCEVAANTSLHAAFRWNSQEDTDQAEFQQSYTQVVAEWARRFGSLLDGWWFDGCYTWPIFHSRGMDWPLWFAAARAGNPFAALAFNDGSFCVGNLQPVIPELDYLSGEIESLVDGQIRLGREPQPVPHLPLARFVPGTRCQWHGLLPVDCFWMHGSQAPGFLADHRYRPVPAGAISAPMEPPVYSDDELYRFMSASLGAGGALTLNVGLYEEGWMGKETVAQLARIKARLVF